MVKVSRGQRVLLAAVALTLGASGCSSSGTTSAPAANASTRSTSPPAHPTLSPTTPSQSQSQQAAFAQLESQFRATLGVYAIDTGTGQTVTYNADTRFAFCSTMKTFAAAALLRQDTDAQLQLTLHYTSADLVDYSPVTSQHVASGMSLESVMTAAIEVSDNTAYNLMLQQLGGPAQLQNFLRGLGDETTNVDRTEPTVNSATPGDPRDTSTPRALATDLRTEVLGNSTLTPTRQAMLTSWLVANTTGGPYIRAAVPVGWKVGDKTGNGDYGTRNDIAVLWPSAPASGSGSGSAPAPAAPIVLAILSNRGTADATSADTLLSDATKIVLTTLAESQSVGSR